MIPRVRLALGALAMAAMPAHAQPHEADGTNHYILRCDDCLPASEKAIGAPTAITTDGAGNVVFVSQSVVFALRRDGRLVRVAGNGVAGNGGDGGPAIDASIAIPATYFEPYWQEHWPLYSGVAFDREGNLYVSDTANHRVRVVGTDGIIQSLGVDGVGVSEFRWPSGIAINEQGQVFVASVETGRVVRHDPDGTVQDLWVPSCLLPWYSPCSTRQLALDASGAVLFGDSVCRVLRWTDPDGIETLAGIDIRIPYYDCAPGYSGDGGPALSAMFRSPFGVAVDRWNRIVIAETFDHCVRRIDENGIVDTIAGQCAVYPPSVGWPGPSVPFDAAMLGDGGPATQALLYQPAAVAVDAEGNVYIADAGNRRIRKVTPGGIITTVAGNGLPLLVPPSP